MSHTSPSTSAAPFEEAGEGAAVLSTEERLQRVLSSAPVSIWEEDWTAVIRAVRRVELAPDETFESWMEANPGWVTEQLRNVRILSINEHTKEMFGADRAEELTRSLEVVFSTRDTLAGFRGELATLHRGETRFCDRMWLRTVKGKKIRVLIDMSFPPMDSDSGWVVVSLMDITHMHQTEARLQQRNRDLETLLYISSHDLKEPLRAIETFSRIVRDRYREALDDKGRDFLDRVVRGAERMDLLLGDLLEVSRAQSIEAAEGTVAGGEVVRQALDPLRATIHQLGAEVEVKPDLPLLHADPTWAARAVSNLVANALKFTRSAERPRVEIDGYRTADEVGISVQDHGPGILPEHRDRIFKLFQRAVPREVPGTGAGLAIVAQVAERHGGRAWVEDAPSGGARFIVTFGSPPFSQDKERPDASTSDTS